MSGITYGKRGDTLVAMPTQQFMFYFVSNEAFTAISREEYKRLKKMQQQANKCLTSGCNQTLTAHDKGYCPDCVDFQKLEYEVEEPEFEEQFSKALNKIINGK